VSWPYKSVEDRVKARKQASEEKDAAARRLGIAHLAAVETFRHRLLGLK
jgi:hypothetical protein